MAIQKKEGASILDDFRGALERGEEALWYGELKKVKPVSEQYIQDHPVHVRVVRRQGVASNTPAQYIPGRWLSMCVGKRIADIGMLGSNVTITFDDAETLTIISDFFELREENHLSTLNGRIFGDIVLETHTSFSNQSIGFLIIRESFGGSSLQFRICSSTAASFADRTHFSFSHKEAPKEKK